MEQQSNAWGIASFVCSILGLLLFLAPYFGLPLSICAIIFYALQKKRTPTGLATAGLIIGIIGAVINSMTGLFILIMFIGISATGF